MATPLDRIISEGNQAETYLRRMLGMLVDYEQDGWPEAEAARKDVLHCLDYLSTVLRWCSDHKQGR